MAKKKDNKPFEAWLPLFLMIGCIVGLILAISLDDYLYFIGGVAVGLLLGLLIWGTAIDTSSFRKEKAK